MTKLSKVVDDLEEENDGDEDIEWCILGIRDYIRTLTDIVDDFKQNKEG